MLLRVRRVRLELGISLSEAAKRARVAPQLLGRIERAREAPWPALRRRLCELYGMSEGDLFGDIDEGQAHLREIAGRSAK